MNSFYPTQRQAQLLAKFAEQQKAFQQHVTEDEFMEDVDKAEEEVPQCCYCKEAAKYSQVSLSSWNELHVLMY
jgi:hypothetical protein